MTALPRIEAALSALPRDATDEQRARAAVAALAAEWQPIKTAPLNTSVLIWAPWAEHYGPGIYRAIHVVTDYSDRWHTTGVAIGLDLDWDRPPTHWMPLPPPPVQP